MLCIYCNHAVSENYAENWEFIAPKTIEKTILYVANYSEGTDVQVYIVCHH